MTRRILHAVESDDHGLISKIYAAAEKCMSLRWPFVIYMYPCSESVGFMAERYNEDDDRIPGREEDNFMVSFFNDPMVPVMIRNGMTVDEVLTEDVDADSVGPLPEIHPQRESTPRLLHKAQVFSIVNDLKKSSAKGGSKVVLSRVIALESQRSPLAVARDYFAVSPGTFRAIYYHPTTGMWITATPETLIDYHLPEGIAHTVALAGTRPAGSGGEWDKKNQREQQIVMKEICRRLDEAGMPVTVSEIYTRNAGNVEHLCQDIRTSGSISPTELGAAIDAINPTPAVAGFPRHAALIAIDRFETHARHCYAGWLGVDREMGADFFVNLRCAMVEPMKDDDGDMPGRYLYNVYVGGGILSASDPDAEWEETKLKSLPLCRAIDPDYEPEE